VLAFTDADCEPAPDWLRRVAEEMGRNGTDIVVGPRLPADSPTPHADSISKSIGIRRRSG
jgi:hypothetical protein